MGRGETSARSAELNRVPVFLLTVFGVFLAACLLSYSSADPPDSLVFPPPESVAGRTAPLYENWCGKYGARTASILLNALGYSAYLLFVPLLVWSYHLWHGKGINQMFLRLLGLVLIFVATSGLIALHCTHSWNDTRIGAGGEAQHAETAAWNCPMIGPGGYLGVIGVYFLKPYFSTVGTTILFVSALVGGLVLACDYTIIRIVLWACGVRPFFDHGDGVDTGRLNRKADRSVRTLSPIRNRNTEIDEPGDEEDEFEPEYDDEVEEEIDEEEDEEEDDEEYVYEDEEEDEYAE